MTNNPMAEVAKLFAKADRMIESGKTRSGVEFFRQGSIILKSLALKNTDLLAAFDAAETVSSIAESLIRRKIEGALWFYSLSIELMRGFDLEPLPTQMIALVGSWHIQVSYLSNEPSKMERYARDAITILEPLTNSQEPDPARGYLANALGALARSLLDRGDVSGVREALGRVPALIECLPEPLAKEYMAMCQEIEGLIPFLPNRG